MKDIAPTVKRSIELIGLFVIGFILVVGHSIIMPLLMAFFISIMLLPLFRFFRKIRLPETISILLCILLMIIFSALVIWLFTSQISILVRDYDKIEQHITRHFDALQSWINKVFSVSAAEQILFLKQQSSRGFSYAGSIAGGAANSASGTLVFFGLLPVYIFLIILYRGIFLKFLLMWFPEAEHNNVAKVLLQTQLVVKSYLLGLLIQVCSVTLLLWGILALLGIEHALLIGIIFAFLNLIPYLGALIGNIIGVLITLASSDRVIDIVYVLGAILLVQLLDNNILMPKIVGSRVKLNALASIVGIILAGTMTGVAGMFLALPVLAVLKIIFDHSTYLKKWGVLLGVEKNLA